MKSIYVIGNCISRSIVDTIYSSKFIQDNFTVSTPEKYIHQYSITDQLASNKVRNAVESCDILIYMPIKNKNFIGIDSDEMRDAVRSRNGIDLRIPVPFFQGYWPESSFVRLDSSSDKINGMLADYPQKGKSTLIHYFDLVLLYCFLTEYHGDDLFENVDLFESSFIDELCHKSIDNLRRREVNDGINISISDFVENNYKSQKLFYTINHPGHAIIKEMCNQILSTRGAPEDEIDKINIETKWVSYQDYPLYPSVAKAISTNIEITDQYVINKQHISRSQFYRYHTNYINSIKDMLKSQKLITSSPKCAEYISNRISAIS
ncbi:hypothetical protein JWJ90_22270 [Desulfobulbus rhabdoformis]|uniref:WcbI family polysaccharide biosynthesis putative acetyltransferase n=1 Tax=Desulfobulbus rhabdoformis TaxID=34032 RepID=UPI0019636144|nr:WcbI family polysaccharide biosynthesis putative acetyltransferase [Desulfobulbus rhabdoformis]MBM9616990.1 hypothetical protein [Desulfobulbus rhabdoformis]